MSFICQDWRSPGDRWIRTDFGWKRLADIRYGPQAVSQRRNLKPRCEPKPRPALLDSGHSGADGAQNRSEVSLLTAAPQVSRHV